MLDLLAVEPVFTRSAYHVQLTMRDRLPLHGLAAAARAAPGTDRQTLGETDTAPSRDSRPSLDHITAVMSRRWNSEQSHQGDEHFIAGRRQKLIVHIRKNRKRKWTADKTVNKQCSLLRCTAFYSLPSPQWDYRLYCAVFHRIVGL